MDEGAFTPPNPPMFGNIDIDFMDQLLDEGCWLQTADGSGFLQPSGPSVSRGLSYPCYPWFSLEGGSSSLTSSNPNPHQSSYQEDGSGAGSGSGSSKPHEGGNSESQDQKSITPSTKSYFWGSDELNKIMWIEPQANPGPLSTVRDRLIEAISNLRKMNSQRDVLIQLWVPVKKGFKSYLTTVQQPHFCHPASERLQLYRDVSERYEFLADEDTKQALGLPGRVFLGKAPEWTPNVRFFRQEEYPRIEFAHKYDVRGSIALPVFEKGTGDCLGVVEIIMTTDIINYRPEVESVCEALKSVNLKSSEIFSPSHEKVGKGTQEATNLEIFNALRIICDAHNLPLAQTWAPCTQQGKDGCWHSDKDALCVSTLDSACYVRDHRVTDFHKACCEHHLLRSQGGIVGQAFDSNQPCFATDVTEYSKVEYPLSHHAKMFGLRSAIAIRLRSIYLESRDYVLEFYLPTDLQETVPGFQNRILQFVFMVIQQQCQSLHFMTVNNLDHQQREMKLESSTSWFSQMVNPHRKGKEIAVSLEFGEEEPNKEFSVTNWGNSEPELQLGQVYSDCEFVKQDSRSKGRVEAICGSSTGGRLPLSYKKGGEKRRTKSQKTISLQTLRQYFAGSLKDAAKSIGVCPTTLKRICRQHGITRWPSRKIKKVGHSLKKLQLVIDSVQGAEGAIKISTFYSNFPELNKPNSQPGSIQAPSMNLNDQPKQHQHYQHHQQTTQLEGSSFFGGSGGTSSNSGSSSSSHTSTSSHCFSTVATNAANSKGACASTVEDPGGFVKRTQSEAQLQAFIKKESSSNQFLERSQSNKSLVERPSLETPPPSFPVSRSWPSREAGAFKAKATFGEEKVRLTIVPNMGFQELQQEIAKRFNLEDLRKIGIKYLDDDKEWVLLTCDADLEECIDIHKSSGSHTIKLALTTISSVGGSVGSSGLS